MPTVWIPALLRELTHNEANVVVPGETVFQVIEQLDARFPGLKNWLLEDDELRPGIIAFVDGEVCGRRLGKHLSKDSEVHFLPSITGGLG